jgi:CheY-like chemotaxis protein
MLNPDSVPVKRPKLLIVDDEPGLREMLLFGLEKRGYEVTTAGDGQEALQRAREHSFDLVVCDIMMPGKNGVEVLQSLKELQPDLEIIMATGYATLETAVQSMKNGAFDYITKPYSLGHLCTVFDKALEHRRLKDKVNYLEELNRLKSDFMATMSHELRTPMASVLGYISLILQRVYGDIPAAQEKALQRAEINARNLLQLINNILDLSKLSADRMALFPEVFSVNEVVREITEAMEPLALSKKLTVKTDVSEPLWLNTDKTKFKQILINLMGNAVKFTRSGSVTLSVVPMVDSSFIEASVQDTGIGIAAEDIPHLFQEFKQLDSSTTREFGGTGLGLAITRRISELMGGKIRVESEKGVGSRFIVDLPVRVPRPLAAPAPELSAETTHENPDDKIILAIDDDSDILKVLSDSMRDTGFRIVGAQSGEEGIALARKLRPHLITLDIMMPRMDGWSVLQVLKNDAALRDIPVYIVSIVDNKALAFSLGVAGYIMKPFRRDELLKQLELVPRNKVQQVLVVDDDPAVQRLFSETLSGENFDVQIVGSGEDAIARMNQIRPDILFLDLGLPAMSGFDVLQSIEDHPSQEKTLVFVMTEKELADSERTFLKARVQMVLQKNPKNLKDMVNKLKERLVTLRAA